MDTTRDAAKASARYCAPTYIIVHWDLLPIRYGAADNNFTNAV
jgi:hypothetical protein